MWGPVEDTNRELFYLHLHCFDHMDRGHVLVYSVCEEAAKDCDQDTHGTKEASLYAE